MRGIKLTAAKLHYHHCPHCSVDRSCMMDCSVFNAHTTDARLMGGVISCEHCDTQCEICPLCKGAECSAEAGYVPPYAISLIDGSMYVDCMICDGVGFVRVCGATAD